MGGEGSGRRPLPRCEHGRVEVNCWICTPSNADGLGGEVTHGEALRLLAQSARAGSVQARVAYERATRQLGEEPDAVDVAIRRSRLKPGSGECSCRKPV